MTREADIKSEQDLQFALSKLVPEAVLEWQDIPQAALRGFLLEFDSATIPLSPDSAEQVMEAPPFWSLLWPAGRALCQLFSRAPSLVAGRQTVDLGCGSGLVATAMGRAGARVVAADSDALSLQVTTLNAEGNGVELFTESAWSGETDTLILADFLYDETNLGQLSSLSSVCEEIVIVDSRLKFLNKENFQYLGEMEGLAVPDLDPHREFGCLKLWYWGPREAIWRQSLFSG